MRINEKVFEKYGIENSKIINLQKFNVVIGKNGAGKTRFLRALKDMLSKSKMTTIYAYFPDMHASYGVEILENEYEVPLYEMIFEGENIELGNFIGYIEQHGFDFLNELLRDIDKYARYKKSIRRERAENIQKDLNALLETLISRKIIFDSEIIVESSVYSGKKTLKDDLMQMSPGELLLFYLSILLIIIKYNKDDDKKLAVLLDEPELHLHPKALIKFLDYLKNESEIEICCIATHSIFLIPLFDFYEVIHIEGGKIQKYNSKSYNNIFENIIGEDESISDFLLSRNVWQYYQFVAECFYLPTVVEKVSTKDEQFLKFLQYVKTLGSYKKRISVLDYGAGAGRLGKMINSIGQNENYVKRKIEYIYYDKYQDKPEDLECISYKNIDEIKQEKRKFNCVVLMNVLHEIDVEEWVNTFNEIYEILADDGYLLVFEVVSLLHGEQPYGDSGYIVLGEEQVRILFGTNNIEMINLKNTDKTYMFVIPKSIIKNASKFTVLEAIKSLKESLYSDLKSKYMIRKEIAHDKERISQYSAKNYGFLSQHYLNSLFAIEMLQGDKVTDLQDKKEVTNCNGKDIENLMMEIGKQSNGVEVERLREKLVTFVSNADREKIRGYLSSNNVQQRKAARYYLSRVSDE